MKLGKAVRLILKDHGFLVGDIDDSYDYIASGYSVEISQFTPAGEAWNKVIWFDGTDSDFITKFREYYTDFDVDREVEFRVELRGKNGVPSSIRALVNDAEWKESKLGMVCMAFNELGEFILPISKIAYMLYKQDWIDSNTLPEQRLGNLRIYLDFTHEYLIESYGKALSFEDWLEEGGYQPDGALYVCYDEFLDEEYRDEGYICSLLKNPEWIEQYKFDIKRMAEEDE